jgi:hypothetical protein
MDDKTINAKLFLDNKQREHVEKHGVKADVNSKLAEWMQEYADNSRKIRVCYSTEFGCDVTHTSDLSELNNLMESFNILSIGWKKQE